MIKRLAVKMMAMVVKPLFFNIEIRIPEFLGTFASISPA